MDELIPLSDATLSKLPDGIRVPRYDRSALTPGIVHIGLGNFHRAHQAWYLHRLMDEGLAQDWAILGAGVRRPDAAQRDRLRAQDCLTTLIELDPEGTSAEVTGSMIDFLPVQDDNAALIAAMADPRIRIVSLTVTEGGYFRTPQGFDADHEDIRFDAAHPATPRTAFGAMIAALAQRRAAGHAPFTAMSCDNLQGNGEVLRDTMVSLARLSDPALAEWIAAEVAFPNSMVDCIVPATGPLEIEQVRAFGIDDAAPVTHENFRQWVIEDRFSAGRPEWDRVGATFSDRVHAYEKMKIRILNAGHQLIANPGELLGCETIADCMADAAIRGFFLKVEREEIAPQVDPVPGMQPLDYVDLIASRFANERIRDTTRRVAFDGSSRHPGFLLPILRERLEAGTSVEGLALAEALWCRMCAGIRENGSEIAANDPDWDELLRRALAARDRPAVWLEQPKIYGDLDRADRFAEAFARWLDRLWAEGTEAVLRSYAEG